MHMMFKSLLSMFLVVAVTACADDVGGKKDDSHDDGEIAHACAHMEEGPSQSMTAGDALEDAPSLNDAHTRYDVTFVSFESDQGGYVAFTPDTAGDFRLYLSADVAFELRELHGDHLHGAVTPESTEDHGDACAAIALSYMFELEAETYVLVFGPMSETSVMLVIEPVDHEH